MRNRGYIYSTQSTGCFSLSHCNSDSLSVIIGISSRIFKKIKFSPACRPQQVRPGSACIPATPPDLVSMSHQVGAMSSSSWMKDSTGVFPVRRLTNSGVSHLSPILRSDGRRSITLENRPGSSGYVCRQWSSSDMYTSSRSDSMCSGQLRRS